MIKKQGWLLLAVTTIFSIWFSYAYFEKAIPFVQLSITMNKDQAEHNAIVLAKELALNMEKYDHVTVFESDNILQAFVELEGGGKQAYRDMITNDYYQPYVWQVRFYKEKEIKEMFVFFTPQGRKYGFVQKLPEDLPGTNISKAKAQFLAEKFVKSWDIDLKKYKQVEYEQQVQTGKRVDHTFVYERQDVTLGKGLIRFKTIVSGDQVTSLQHYVKIPDEFNRRYAEMYSQNVILAQFARTSALILYIFIIGLFSLLFLYRRRYFLIVSHGKMWLLLGFISLISTINGLPLIWTHYATTSIKAVFLLQVFGMMVAGVLFQVAFMGTIVWLAEAISRYVFGEQIQFFKLWSKDVAPTYTVTEQTVLGYCIAIIKIGYLVFFSMVATSWGWWLPLSSLFNPNILSMYAPFLTPIVMAFFAGFWEEFGFRVLPIAGTLLLTRHSKNQRYWLIGIIIVQALLFGAAHANYPQQPAYYRVVEMLAQSFAYGLMYYCFGVLPAIICHYVYDAVLMLIPIWSSTFVIQKLLGLFCVGIPLWVILMRAWQQGKITAAPKASYNSAWKPSGKELVEKLYVRLKGGLVPDQVKYYTYIFGLIGIILFGFSQDFQFDTPPIAITAVQAKNIARSAVQDRFGTLSDSYKELSSFVDTVATNGNKFIYQKYGRDTYADLQGSYVVPPYYAVRYAKFTGSVEERAEEYGAWIGVNGVLLNVWHTLPESAQGADISESKAEALAYNFVKDEYDLAKADLELISIDSVKHESRRDWTIVLRDITHYDHDEGQARITLNVAGDQVVGMMRHVYAPQEWSRQEQDRLVKKSLVTTAAYFVLMLCLLLFACFACQAIGLHSMLLRIIALGTAFFAILKTIGLWLRWDQTMFNLNTLQPLLTQYGSLAMSHITSSFGSGFVMTALIVFAVLLGRKGVRKELPSLILPAMSIGCGMHGLFTFFNTIFDMRFEPQLPMYNLVNFKSSTLGIIVSYYFAEVVITFITIVGLMTIADFLVQRYKLEWLYFAVFCLGGFAICGSGGDQSTWWSFIIAVILWAVVWYLLCRYLYTKNIEILFITLITMQALRLVPSVWYGTYHGILLDVCVGTLIIMIIAVWTVNRLQKEK